MPAGTVTPVAEQDYISYVLRLLVFLRCSALRKGRLLKGRLGREQQELPIYGSLPRALQAGVLDIHGVRDNEHSQVKLSLINGFLRSEAIPE